MESDDLERLARGVRYFLDKLDWRNRIVGMAKLYLEFPDVGMMHDAHRQIMQSLSPAMLTVGRDFIRYIDEETIEIEVGGISIILTCKQRFMTQSGRAAGYTSMRFPPPVQNKD